MTICQIHNVIAALDLLYMLYVFHIIVLRCIRYNEGLLDIMAASVEMEKEPREVFKDVSKGNAVTK